MIRAQRQLPKLEWYKEQQRREIYWTARFHGYVCVVREVSGKPAPKYQTTIWYLDPKKQKPKIADAKNVAHPDEAKKWCTTTLAAKNLFPQRRTLRWRELTHDQCWMATQHGYVCYVDYYSRDGYIGYWPSIYYLRTSSDTSIRDTSSPFYTLRGAQFWCADYLTGHGVYKELPRISIQRTPWYWIAAVVVLIIFLLLIIATNSR